LPPRRTGRCDPNGTRTRVLDLKDRASLPLDDGAVGAGDGSRTHSIPLTKRALVHTSHTGMAARAGFEPASPKLTAWCTTGCANAQREVANRRCVLRPFHEQFQEVRPRCEPRRLAVSGSWHSRYPPCVEVSRVERSRFRSHDGRPALEKARRWWRRAVRASRSDCQRAAVQFGTRDSNLHFTVQSRATYRWSSPECLRRCGEVRTRQPSG
jgi:hypothetical protein